MVLMRIATEHMSRVLIVLMVLMAEQPEQDEQEGFPLVYSGSAFPSRTAFVFNSKFYLSNKLEVTNRLRLSSYVYLVFRIIPTIISDLGLIACGCLRPPC